MHKLLAVALLSLSLNAIAADVPTQSREAWTNAQPQVRVTVNNGAVAGTFNVIAVITDRHTGKVLAKPKMTIRAGSWAKAEVGAPGKSDKTSVSLSATVDPSGQNAAYFADIRRADGKTDSESGTIRIAR